MFFERQPDAEDRRQLLNDYLRQIRNNELAKIQRRNEDIEEQTKRLATQTDEMNEEIEKEHGVKADKQKKMRDNCEEVRKERNATIEKEKEYRMNQKPITNFPYTHGDTVEATRAQIRQEMHEDLKTRYALLRTMEEERNLKSE